MFLFLNFIFSSELLTLTNEYRKENNMEDLKPLDSLGKAAQSLANDMCFLETLTHFGYKKEYRTLADRLRMNDFIGSNIGENIARQQNDDINQIFNVWKKSKEHRKNILGDFVYTGIGTCKDKQGLRYWVQVFAKEYTNNDLKEFRESGSGKIKKKCDEQNSKADKKDIEPRIEFVVNSKDSSLKPPENLPEILKNVYDFFRERANGKIESKKPEEKKENEIKKITTTVKIDPKYYSSNNSIEPIQTITLTIPATGENIKEKLESDKKSIISSDTQKKDKQTSVNNISTVTVTQTVIPETIKPTSPPNIQYKNELKSSEIPSFIPKDKIIPKDTDDVANKLSNSLKELKELIDTLKNNRNDKIFNKIQQTSKPKRDKKQEDKPDAYNFIPEYLNTKNNRDNNKGMTYNSPISIVNENPGEIKIIPQPQKREKTDDKQQKLCKYLKDEYKVVMPETVSEFYTKNCKSKENGGLDFNIVKNGGWDPNGRENPIIHHLLIPKDCCSSDENKDNIEIGLPLYYGVQQR